MGEWPESESDTYTVTFVAHDHRERNDQELGNQLIAGAPVIDRARRVRRRPRLGGLLNFYERAA